MIDWFDLDVDASRVALRDGEPVGFGNLGLRGDEAWIGGVGVVTSARRQGIGELLMEALHDEAAARGVKQVWLEVIEQNDAAYRLYEKLGYDLVRWVEVWTLSSALLPRAFAARFPWSRRTRASASCGRSVSRGSARTRRSRTTTMRAGRDGRRRRDLPARGRGAVGADRR